MENNNDFLAKMIKETPLEVTSDDFTQIMMSKIAESRIDELAHKVKPLSDRVGIVIGSILITFNLILVYFLFNFKVDSFKQFNEILIPANLIITNTNLPFIGLIFASLFILILLDSIIRNKLNNHHNG